MPGTATASTAHGIGAYRVAPCGLGHGMCLQDRTRRLDARPGADRPRGQLAGPQNHLSDPTRRERAHQPAGRAGETPFNWPGLGTVPGARTTETHMVTTNPELGCTRPDPLTPTPARTVQRAGDPQGRACQGFLVTTPQVAPKGWWAGQTRAPWAGPLLVRDGGGGQLLVISSQDALPGLQQRDPAAGFQGLRALVDDQHVEVAVGQQLQRAVGRGTWGNRNCEPSPEVLAASYRRDLTEGDTTGQLAQNPVWHLECVRGVHLGINIWEEH